MESFLRGQVKLSMFVQGNQSQDETQTECDGETQAGAGTGADGIDGMPALCGIDKGTIGEDEGWRIRFEGEVTLCAVGQGAVGI